MKKPTMPSGSKPTMPSGSKPTMPSGSKPTPVNTMRENGISDVTIDVPMPEIKNNRGSKSKYPFNELTKVGMSFGVKDKTAAALASVVSGQNRKNKSEKLDDDGNVVYTTTTQTNKDGSTIEVPNTNKPEMNILKKFYAANCDPATDPDGASVRVFRSV